LAQKKEVMSKIEILFNLMDSMWVSGFAFGIAAGIGLKYLLDYIFPNQPSEES